ncbi:MAG: ferrous iron transporter B [Clostridia bacterium]|nr:ferrous iron transporter B [Clostridia bacterium]
MQKVLLVGNPNTGKTTLFNTIAKASEHAGNWHGVTVAVKEKKFTFNKKEYLLCDLPGIYSLDYISKEEQISAEYIKENKNAIVICMLDANNLKRNLYLAIELLKQTKNIILAINMAKEYDSFEHKKIEDLLGVKVVKIDARSKKSVKSLLQVLDNFEIEKTENKQGEIGQISLQETKQKSKENFQKIDEILSVSKYKKNTYYGYSKIDKILLNPWFAIPVFLLVLGGVFFITFGVVGETFSSFITGVVEKCFSCIILWLKSIISSKIAINFIDFAVFGGALTVVSFMPQILLMMVCLNFLEDVGYLSRVAFVFDKIFKKIGLTGKSVFSLIMGFGCTTSALQTTRILETKKARERTAVLLPFMSCSAKLPIYAVICSAFFSKYKALMVFLLYIIGVILMILVSLLMNAFSKQKSQDSFILEMPKFRVPNFKKVISGAIESAKSFLLRVGGILVVSSVVIYLLNNFSISLKYVGSGDGKSILEVIAGAIDFLFVPLGFGNKGAVVAILSGIIAKEMVVSSLAIVNGVTAGELAKSLIVTTSSVHFNTLSAFSFLVFVLLYSPCVSAVVSMKKETSRKIALQSFVLQFVVAYFTSFVIYNVGLVCKKSIILGVGLVILLALLFVLVIKLIKRKKHKNLTFVTCDGCAGSTCGNNKLCRGR